MRIFPVMATTMPINDFQRLRFSSSESSESRCTSTENSEDGSRLELERSMVDRTMVVVVVVVWWCGVSRGMLQRHVEQ